MRFKKSDSRPNYPVTRQGMNSLFKLHPLECQVTIFPYFYSVPNSSIPGSEYRI